MTAGLPTVDVRIVDLKDIEWRGYRVDATAVVTEDGITITITRLLDESGPVMPKSLQRAEYAELRGYLENCADSAMEAA